MSIVLFTDFGCPFCERVVATIDQLFDDYPGQLRLVVKQFPLHRASFLAAEAALEAEAQGRFWPMHDLLMTHPGEHTRDDLVAYAAQAGLDVDAFTAALDRHTHRDEVVADLEAARALGVVGAPAFLIDGRLYAGSRPIASYRRAIDAALARRAARAAR